MYKKIFIAVILLFANTYCQALYDFQATVNSEVNIGENFNPNSWIRLTGISVPTAGNWQGGYGDSNGATLCTTMSLTLCNDVRSNVGHGTVGYWKPSLTFYQQRVQDSKGRTFSFAVAFPSGQPVLHLYEYYLKSYRPDNRSYNGILAFPKGIYPTEPDETDKYNFEISAGEHSIGSCNGDCTLYQIGYFNSSTSHPVLYVKLPSDLVSGETITFPNLKLMTLTHWHKSNSGWYIDDRLHSNLIVSVTLKIPESKCYLSIDGANNLDFGSINSTTLNGWVSAKHTVIKSECIFSKVGTKQFLKIEPISGGTVSKDGYSYQFNNDKSGVPALGFTFDINTTGAVSTPTCTDSGYSANKKFNTDYLIRTLSGKDKEEYRDNLSVSLCKYGIPAAKFGSQTLGVRVVSRWE
ncbi:hypothetical protein [Yersinia enterocolitica]|uniref:hypothetical protein n=1 Tax=Yersinia enterocolitica TaxID=630 RepID=UPI001C60D070|nr:hypothetical protein [Yersinia enterocolitica]MBW5879271.1 hypothetical protein [Yersinia enterocolitica]